MMLRKGHILPLVIGIVFGASAVSVAWTFASDEPAAIPVENAADANAEIRLLKANMDSLTKYVRLHGKAIDGLLNHVEALEERRPLQPYDGKSTRELREMLHP